MGEALLRLEGVTRTFGEAVKTEVLHGIDLELKEGEFAALIGPSGSGKSTLLHIIGLLDRATTGVVKLGGRDVEQMTDDERTGYRGKTLGFVFQFHHLMPAFTAVENVMMPMIATSGRVTAEARVRAESLLEAMSLGPQKDNRATDLSGGQQQRVAIARALAMNPLLVLADEPTGNLDTGTGDQAFELLREFNVRERTAFLIVTHDSRIADRCDRVIELVDGRITSDRREG